MPNKSPDADATILGCVYQANKPYPEGDTGEATVTGFKRVVCFDVTFNGKTISLERSEESFAAIYPKLKRGPE